MKQSKTRKSIALEHQSPFRLADGSFDAIRYLPYDRVLRTLGSMLQRENLEEFDLQHSDDVYTVRGQSSRMNSGRFSLIERIFHFGKFMRNRDRAITGELRYSVSDILHFESEVRAQRKESSEIPDPYFPSQILRGVGCYLDKREGSRLVGVKVKNRWVTIDYLARDGRVEKVNQDFEYFYDYGVRMYMQRSNRSKLPPPSDPTLFVTWEGAQKRHKLSRTTV